MKIKTLVFAISLVGAASTAAWAQDSMSATAAVDADMYQATIDGLNQVADRYTGSVANWADYVSVHGGAYVDAKAGNMNESSASAGENTNRVSVTNAFLAVQATPNDWSKFDMALNYSDASDSYSSDNDGDDSIFVDQAYATLGNSNRYPLFLQVGKQYLPFGNYDLYPATKSLSQVLSESNQTDMQLGFVSPKGLYGSVYTFQSDVSKSSDGNDDSNPMFFGAALGLKRSNDRMDVDFGLGYMNNMVGVNAIADEVGNSYVDAVDAMSAFVNFKTGPFGLKLDYVTALDKFAQSDIAYDGDGAEPSAADATISYDFNKRNMDQQIYVGYQASSEASELDLPEDRMVVGYNMYPWSNVMVGAEITSDSDYDVADGGSGDDYYTYNLRFGVQF